MLIMKSKWADTYIIDNLAQRQIPLLFFNVVNNHDEICLI